MYLLASQEGIDQNGPTNTVLEDRLEHPTIKIKDIGL